jgi:hypothetical protein
MIHAEARIYLTRKHALLQAKSPAVTPIFMSDRLPGNVIRKFFRFGKIKKEVKRVFSHNKATGQGGFQGETGTRRLQAGQQSGFAYTVQPP